MAIPQPRDLTSAGGNTGVPAVSHVDLVSQTLRQMRQAGASRTVVDGYEGLYLPSAATMPQHTWAGIVELALDSDFRGCGQFYPEDQALVEAEHHHWCAARAGQVAR